MLALFTIYRRPTDYPTHFVVRRFLVGIGPTPRPDATPWAVVETLDQARAALPPGLINIFRDDADDPQIVETWI